ncbi:hypothetical protein XELAEV_18035760mg [Xenopus laevis]|uniref:Uncharacterized protein n=1 Tax=Xenopus laevis TaxID=8355 RepID=A0A974CGM1_XENLA|nr:hypothetical protein XELAEV_18035760mg [Xenopus laevis]
MLRGIQLNTIIKLHPTHTLDTPATAGSVLQPSQSTKLQSMFSLTHQLPYQSVIESIHIIHQGELCTGVFPLKSSNKS